MCHSGVMELSRYVQDVHQQLATAAEAGGDEARVVAERLLGADDASVRLTLLEALGDAAAEITSALAPGSVDLRLRGREPNFVVTLPPTDVAEALEPDPAPAATPEPPPAAGTTDGSDDELTRINLRLP